MPKNPDAKTERRWLRSVIAASAEPLPDFAWMRSNRKKPAAVAGETATPAPKVVVLPRRPANLGRGAIAAR